MNTKTQVKCGNSCIHAESSIYLDLAVDNLVYISRRNYVWMFMYCF